MFVPSKRKERRCGGKYRKGIDAKELRPSIMVIQWRKYRRATLVVVSKEVKGESPFLYQQSNHKALEKGCTSFDLVVAFLVFEENKK